MYLGMAAGPRAAAAHIDQPMATCLLAARTLPLLPLVTSHRAPSTEHWALSTLGTGRWARCLLCRQRLAPFIPISAPTLPSLGFPPPSRRGKHGQCALSSPALISTPQNTRLAFTRTLRGSFISPTPQLRRIKGLVATFFSPCASLPALRPFAPTRPSKVIRTRRSSTPLSPFGIALQTPRHCGSFVISGRHAHQPGRRPSPARLLVGTASLYELHSRL